MQDTTCIYTRHLKPSAVSSDAGRAATMAGSGGHISSTALRAAFGHCMDPSRTLGCGSEGSPHPHPRPGFISESQAGQVHWDLNGPATSSGPSLAPPPQRRTPGAGKASEHHYHQSCCSVGSGNTKFPGEEVW